MTRLRVGVFGGAFDPPHVTHVALARAAMAQRDLDTLRIFPTGHPWHKARVLSAAAHRIAMAELAFGDIAGVVVDPRETLRAGPTYTLDTLQELQSEQPDAELVLIMGSDQARALPGWHGWREIVSAAVVCVAERLESAPSVVAAEPAGSSTRPASRFDPAMLPGLPAGARFEFLELPPVATSATDIRARLARHQRITGLVPPAVERYIEQHHLYAPPPDDH